jgi:hypothetical protein
LQPFPVHFSRQHYSYSTSFSSIPHFVLYHCTCRKVRESCLLNLSVARTLQYVHLVLIDQNRLRQFSVAGIPAQQMLYEQLVENRSKIKQQKVG